MLLFNFKFITGTLVYQADSPLFAQSLCLQIPYIEIVGKKIGIEMGNSRINFDR